MRVHTTAVPATKYLPERIHCKFTDDNNIPNNITDKTFNSPNESDTDHDLAVERFLNFHNLSERDVKRINETLTKRGYIYQVLED